MVPLSRLTPAEWNPRTVREERFKNLCASIEADPDFLWRRPILATLDGTIYAGNMRYRAAAHLGIKEIPAVIEDIPEQLAKERALRDNAQWGEWDDDQLAEMVIALAEDGTDVKLLGIEDAELSWLLGMGPDPSSGATGDASSGPARDIGHTMLVRAVLTPVAVSLFERALLMTGVANRASALTIVLEEYIASKGQFRIPGEGSLEAFIAPGDGGKPHRARNPRR